MLFYILNIPLFHYSIIPIIYHSSIPPFHAFPIPLNPPSPRGTKFGPYGTGRE